MVTLVVLEAVATAGVEERAGAHVHVACAHSPAVRSGEACAWELRPLRRVRRATARGAADELEDGGRPAGVHRAFLWLFPGLLTDCRLSDKTTVDSSLDTMSATSASTRVGVTSELPTTRCYTGSGRWRRTRNGSRRLQQLSLKELNLMMHDSRATHAVHVALTLSVLLTGCRSSRTATQAGSTAVSATRVVVNEPLAQPSHPDARLCIGCPQSAGALISSRGYPAAERWVRGTWYGILPSGNAITEQFAANGVNKRKESSSPETIHDWVVIQPPQSTDIAGHDGYDLGVEPAPLGQDRVADPTDLRAFLLCRITRQPNNRFADAEASTNEQSDHVSCAYATFSGASRNRRMNWGGVKFRR